MARRCRKYFQRETKYATTKPVIKKIFIKYNLLQVQSCNEPSLAPNKAAIRNLSPLNFPLGCTDAYTCPCTLSLPLVSLLKCCKVSVGAEPLRGMLGNDGDTWTQARTFRELNDALRCVCGRLRRKIYHAPEEGGWGGIGFHSIVPAISSCCMSDVRDTNTNTIFHLACTGLWNTSWKDNNNPRRLADSGCPFLGKWQHSSKFRNLT